MLKKIQKIGKSKDKRRVCLWNRKLIELGFPIGQTIHVWTSQTRGGEGDIRIRPDKNGTRKVSRVMNHGNELPVIDLKQTNSLDLSGLGEIGGKVAVRISQGLITIKKQKD